MTLCRGSLSCGLLWSMFLFTPAWSAENQTPPLEAPAEKETQERTAPPTPPEVTFYFLDGLRVLWQMERKNPPVPFELSPQEEADVDAVLQGWEKKNGRIFNLTCAFKIWEYDHVFGPAEMPKKQSTGQLRYIGPDKAEFKIDGADGERWACDDKATYEYNRAKKQIIERHLPKELQGKFLTDGPYPFFFGVTAKKLKQRFWVRIVTPDEVKNEVWIAAYPRFWQDATRFQRIEIILHDAEPIPFAMQFILPNGKSRTVYRFSVIRENSIICLLPEGVIYCFSRLLPPGWERVVVKQQLDTTEGDNRGISPIM
jgi:TIGR03009 family protein